MVLGCVEDGLFTSHVSTAAIKKEICLQFVFVAALSAGPSNDSIFTIQTCLGDWSMLGKASHCWRDDAMTEAETLESRGKAV